jgi:hypothetical protein
MKSFYATAANIIFLSHITFGMWLLVGWQFESWRTFYLLSLALWILSWVVLRVCPLTFFEFTLRNKAGNAINPDEEFIHYYTKKFFGITLPMAVIYLGGVVAFCIMVLLVLAQ